MITLGINAAFHDSAAALVVDGVPLAAAEEERFTRIKHAKRPLPFTAWELPFNAIASCLGHAGLTLADVDHVAYSFDPWRFAAGRGDLPIDENASLALPLTPERHRNPALAPWDSPWDGLFMAHLLNAPAQLADGAPHHLRHQLLGPHTLERAATHWQWQYLDHHLCHQASAFLAAPFLNCAVMTLDGRGERATTSYGVWRDGQYRSLGEVEMPHSLGLLYERVTTHLGFLHSSDEYKVMALAAMGQPRWAQALADQVHVRSGGQLRIDEIDLTALAGAPREPGTPLLQRHLDLAASLQHMLERKVLTLAGWLREASGEHALAMAGGVALNCVMNSRLRDEGPFEAVWVQPAAGDAGTALGAALWADARARSADPHEGDAKAGWTLAPRRWHMTHAYLGPEWSDTEIESLLRWAGLPYEHLPDDTALAERAAALLADDLILGWFQGRMEWGPRALGARSILASPMSPQMQARLNDLKDREDFRPVAPAITAEAFAAWFKPAHVNGGSSPFMLFTHQVLPAQASRIPSAFHKDGSARVQTVHADTNPRLHALLRAFGQRTGVPVLVNTSFNVRGQPLVCSPKDALEAFFTTPLDALVIGHFVLIKPGAPQ
jgi:carbamoyltransferase